MPRLLQKIGGSSAPSAAMITAQNPAVLSQPIPGYAPPLPTFPPAPPPLPQQEAPLDMSVIMHCSNSDYCNLVKDYYYVDSVCYDMESINLATMSVPGELGISAVDRHLGDGDWSGYEFGDNEWNMDELWPFRNLQGKET
ncbi:hypothetical protein OIU85_013911 [Salix viminalis]|uniref:Uncharacterized protein n=1 Tax=Salix viminalis TaxID=40686 RepID=A0A9Q0NMV1_SALVM|nr:hypothetical protein OIU85_013911 [Salix viminalis]